MPHTSHTPDAFFTDGRTRNTHYHHHHHRRRYPGKSVLGASVIFLGACVAMFLPISRLLGAKASQGDAARSHEYEPEHLRGSDGDYAIVEGEC